MMSERVQKVLARAGYGSRRKCEELILAGRVTIDGAPVEIGQNVTATTADIRVDGERISLPAARRYILFYKPRGVLSSLRSQGGKPIITDFLPNDRRVFPVGRLDLESEGLLLVTDDGELANRLTHPRYEHEKEYRVLLDRRPTEVDLQKWRRGVRILDGELTQPVKVELIAKEPQGTWVRVIMKEGKKRQIREVAAKFNLSVLRLIRVRFGPFELGDLRPGNWRELDEEEVHQLIST
jgi:23S rRNA pseudouridine2605 synthase